jgi:hypothetical protein
MLVVERKGGCRSQPCLEGVLEEERVTGPGVDKDGSQISRPELKTAPSGVESSTGTAGCRCATSSLRLDAL